MTSLYEERVKDIHSVEFESDQLTFTAPDTGYYVISYGESSFVTQLQKGDEFRASHKESEIGDIIGGEQLKFIKNNFLGTITDIYYVEDSIKKLYKGPTQIFHQSKRIATEYVFTEYTGIYKLVDKLLRLFNFNYFYVYSLIRPKKEQ